jgi:hypothetical protein
MDEEIWRPVVGYETTYKVSNLGRVRRIKRGEMDARNKTIWTERGGSYLAVRLSNNNRARNKLVHRLVAEAFLPRIEGKDFVNHIDSNRQNPRLSNLEWCTRSENAKHALLNRPRNFHIIRRGSNPTSRTNRCRVKGHVTLSDRPPRPYPLQESSSRDPVTWERL